jgi:integrase/recombinase XerD
MTVDQATVARFGENLKSRGKQPATVESYCRDAQRFLDYLGRSKLPLNQVESTTLVGYQGYLREECEERDNSIRRTVIGIRQFFRYLNHERAIGASPFDHVPIPLRDETLPDALDEEDIETLLEVASSGRPDCKASRDAAMVSLLAREGLKANELISLTWKDLLKERETASLRIGGNRSRAVVLSTATAQLINAYRTHYDNIKHPAILQSTQKHMFISFKGREAASPLPEMTRHGLKFILYEIGDKAGISRLNTEQLRHFAVNYMIGLGRSPEEIMGHLGLRRIGNIAKHLAKSKTKIKLPDMGAARPVEGATRA